MAWLDDRIYAHPKIRDVPRATRWIYVASLAYASGFGTGGVLTAGQLKAIECTKRDRELLIEVGLWTVNRTNAKDGAICIHDWADHNAKRDAKREADRLRKRAARAKDAEMSAGQGADSPAEIRGTDNDASGGNTEDGPRVRDRGRPPDDGVKSEVLQDTAAAEAMKSTSSTTNSHYAETDNPENPAAAVESPTETDIRDACQRFGADLNVVEPLAHQLPGAVFAATVAKHAVKVKRGSVDDVPALFVRLLQAELKDQAKAIAKQPRALPPIRLPEAERPKPQTGEAWVRTVVPTLRRHPLKRVEQLVLERSDSEGWDHEELAIRLDLARELHQAEAA